MGIRGSVGDGGHALDGSATSSTTTTISSGGALAGVYDITVAPYNATTAAADNTAAIQAAINDAKANGGKVYVPPGVFNDHSQPWPVGVNRDNPQVVP